uniref:Uncharacterized protein n=3 Tax=Avena sativa TaxID=4498 RepID=A0ACD5X1I3_AVESA
MGTLEEQMKALSVQHQPLRRGRTPHDELTASVAEIQVLPSQKASNDSQSAENTGSELALPEDILFHVHTLMPMRDAARAACVSRVFLNSWRCYPRLTLDTETLGIHLDTDEEEEKIESDFVSRVDHIMQNHSGNGLKKVKIRTHPCRNLHPSNVDRCLQIAISPGIEEFELQIYRRRNMEYDFPSSLLTTARGSSIRSFVLTYCAFHSTMTVGCLSSLARVYLRCVHITGDELYCFLSNCPALEQLDLSNCSDMIFLKIPHLLIQLNLLWVQHCHKLQMIEANAPKLRDFNYTGMPIHISLGDSSQVRVIEMHCEHESRMIYFARTKLPSIAPNLQILHLSSCNETINIPMITGKFNCLKYLELEIMLQLSSLSPDFDFHSLVSFLDASHALETFILRVEAPALQHDVVLEYSEADSSRPGCLSGYRHEKLRNMMITGFCSAKSMIELTNHILEKTVSLECLTLDTTRGHDRRLVMIDKCLRMSKEAVMEAEKACLSIRRHIQGRVPSTVNLKVIEPCSTCHTLEKCYDALQYTQFL